jgi:xanthine dehydrogenase accessory factor
MLNRIQPVAARGLLQPDDVLPWLLEWRRGGQRTALVTVVGVEGGAPRSVGAQMAVSETGRYVGYLSGGCVEQAVALEALAAIRDGSNRLIRYGRDSKYFDIRLPCGAGLDIYFDQQLDESVIERLMASREKRSLTALRTDFSSGRSDVFGIPNAGPEAPVSDRDGDTFTRVYVPPLKMQLIGIGPAMPAIARLASGIGFDVEAASPDEGTQTELTLAGLASVAMTDASVPFAFRPDSWTAAVLAFHEHHWEPPILEELLKTPCFYIGAVGSRTVHAGRLRILVDRGVDEHEFARIRGPIGLIPGAKGRATLAIGVLAEVMAEAKARRFVA